ncbi:MAG: S46 family peptidase, partial [Gemmatimonadales bacterium]
MRNAFSLAAALVILASVVQAQGPVDLDTVRAGRFDAGKMWTFEYAPSQYFTDTYGFDANDAWFERARLSAVRVPGCSASFVSPDGLLATNHHCIRGRLASISREGETLLDDGFVAAAIEDERRIPGYFVDQLIAAEDVSAEVFAALDNATTDEERTAARRAVIASIQAQARERHADSGGDSLHVQVVGLYDGGRYSLYVFRRFTDVRMVVAAELQMGFFGGDNDNFTYPRYALDFAFLRVYQDGQPYQTD